MDESVRKLHNAPAWVTRERQGEISMMQAMLAGTESFIIHAPPFGGKDTSAEIMAEVFSAKWASSGDLLRRAELDPAARQSIDRGDVVASDVFFDHALPLIAGPEQAGHMLWLSAVGRCVGEPARVAAFLAQRDHRVAAVICIEVEPEELRKRRNRGREGTPRPDDGVDQFEHRLQEFERKTIPAIQEYAELVPLVRVNGNQHPHNVALAIIDGLYAELIG